jgi:hypothetical protein
MEANAINPPPINVSAVVPGSGTAAVARKSPEDGFVIDLPLEKSAGWHVPEGQKNN